MTDQTSDDEPLPPGLDLVVVPRTSDIGGLEVRRALPTVRRRMVGPFVFLDQMGPTVLRAGSGLDVRPHPHIGLATVTYLFEGEILHRDSLGTVQPIRPGAVNWMTAGRGIAHSERTAPELRAADNPLSGIQMWVALPKDREETDPAFAHHPADSLPVVEGEGKRVRLIVGSLFGATAPVPQPWPMAYADAVLDAGARLEVPAFHEERAVYIAAGRIEVAGTVFEAGRLLVLHPSDPLVLRAAAPSRVMLLGGEPMDGPRNIWWNFVSSSKDRIEQAKADWRAGRFGAVPDEHEFIPLPGEEPTPVRYP
ncbi:pirin family protein [Azospirillum sp. RWY-5-1]|uniref:Pirin family protein n=1 Tax=Azospirillum oleiclasticum TaxID=2735135 RepID=A0ABX2T3W5_9PROT|nr:pirin family protein [Azospirillum oleiclasticum]NYZ11680.1 pirin family protein [Azospirillum oleiclasticum]NYZ18841.1 pirin family protein [Azospirillum oleiclasticum]